MKQTEYNRLCERLGLSKQGAQADFLGVSIRTAHGYANGSPIPEAVAKLLRLMVEREIKPEDVK